MSLGRTQEGTSVEEAGTEVGQDPGRGEDRRSLLHAAAFLPPRAHGQGERPQHVGAEWRSG